MGAADVPEAILRAIGAARPPDPEWSFRAAEKQGRSSLPRGGLGRLDEIGRWLAAIQRTDRPRADPMLVAVFVADHGMTARGTSIYPAGRTGPMLGEVLRTRASAIHLLAKRAGAALRFVDMGVVDPPPGFADDPTYFSERVGPGTRDFVDGPAMTRAEAFRAVEAGLRLADRWAGREGFRVIALGEIGIGNTTSAAALIAALTGSPPSEVVGRGSGLDDAGLDRKRALVAAALARHGEGIADAWDWPARVGGFEILGLAGLAIGAAGHGAAIVLDGLISTAAGLVAASLCPDCVGSMIASHRGAEPGHRAALGSLGLVPILDLGLRLGEGSGAALALPIVAASADLLRDLGIPSP